MTKFKEDHTFGKEGENELNSILEKKGYAVFPFLSATSVHDISFTKGKQKYSGEIKSRRCTKEQYDDTMIGANKLAEAWQKYYDDGTETIFFFIFTNGTYFLKPFENIPRIEYKAGRWDRGKFDNKKGYSFYKTEHLIDIIYI